MYSAQCRFKLGSQSFDNLGSEHIDLFVCLFVCLFVLFEHYRSSKAEMKNFLLRIRGVFLRSSSLK